MGRQMAGGSEGEFSLCGDSERASRQGFARFSLSLLQRHDDYLFIHDSGCLHLRPQKHISEHWLFIIGTASEALTWKLMIMRVTSRCQSPRFYYAAPVVSNIAASPLTGHHVTNSAAPLSSITGLASFAGTFWHFRHSRIVIALALVTVHPSGKLFKRGNSFRSRQGGWFGCSHSLSTSGEWWGGDLFKKIIVVTGSRKLRGKIDGLRFLLLLPKR